MIKTDLEEKLGIVIGKAAGQITEDEAFVSSVFSLNIPPERIHGDLSSNSALQLSKILKKNPRIIAESLVQILEKEISVSPLKDEIGKIEIAGAGFINFFIKDEYFYKKIEEIIRLDSDFGKVDLGNKEKVQIEFVSANPTGPLSIAHARQAAVGDALSRIMEFLGFSVTREYYLNDEGNQINILGNSIKLRLKELRGEKIDFPEDYYQGDYVKDMAAEIENLKLENQNFNFSEYGVKNILDGIKNDLADFNVKFNVWSSQGALSKSGKIEDTIEFLRKKDFIYDSEGAVWFKSTLFGDDKDRVIIKSDKSYTYLAPDIAYHRDKFARGFKRVINLWGPDHHGYIPRIRAAVSALGQEKDALSVIIVQLVTLLREGKVVPMSTRKASYVTLRQIIDEVGKDVARFFLVARRVSSHLDFDLDLAKKESQENPVYYIQYAFARISSILHKEKEENFPHGNADLKLLTNLEELMLMRKLAQFPLALSLCLDLFDPYPLTQYLVELAADFHKCYDKHKVLDLASLDLSCARLKLLNAVRIVLRNGLLLSGLSAPERM
ncbi:MAG: arginine--tRNA ligase [Candidatus Omnitrophota bacterium]|nr:arginine--tRNA ligase [Candidatus Omnitrophota bacterium]